MSRRSVRKIRHLKYTGSESSNICRNCGHRGSHFAPPIWGDKGFYTCGLKVLKEKE